MRKTKRSKRPRNLTVGERLRTQQPQQYSELIKLRWKLIKDILAEKSLAAERRAD